MRWHPGASFGAAIGTAVRSEVGAGVSVGASVEDFPLMSGEVYFGGEVRSAAAQVGKSLSQKKQLQTLQIH